MNRRVIARWARALFIAALAGALLGTIVNFIASARAQDTAPDASILQSIPSATASFAPTRRLTIMGAHGRTATIDFSGDKLTVTGDLPLDEAAKLFVQYVFDFQCKPGAVK